MSSKADLDLALLKLSPRDVFTLRQACEGGIHVFGAPGSAKTSGTGATLARALLRANIAGRLSGGLVLCAKPEEVDLWRRYAKENGREESVLIFDEHAGFNFIQYELSRQGAAGISNVIECLIRVLESADTLTGTTGSSSDPFWAQATRQALSYSIPLICAAYGTVTVANIVDFVVSAASREEQYNEADFDTYAARTLRKVVGKPSVPMTDELKRSMLDFWFHQWPNIPLKTRGNITISLSTRLDRFKHGRLRKCFCAETTIVPEMTFHGAIIVMAMPVLTWNEDGIIGQQLFKYMWQRAVESRNGLEPQHRVAPVFLFADESQYFVSTRDDEFLSTCRSSRAIPVFMTQTLPTYYARLGKDKTDAADGIVGKFATQVFHQNACVRTNELAAKSIGRMLHKRKNKSQNRGTNRQRGMQSGQSTNEGSNRGGGGSSGNNQSSYNRSYGYNKGTGTNYGDNVSVASNEGETSGYGEQMDYILEPAFFATSLKTGGPRNRNLATAVWFKAGGQFKAADGGNFLIPTFRQLP